MSAYKLGDIAEQLGAELRGDGEVSIRGLATLKQAQADQMAFLANPKYRDQLQHTAAAAVILQSAQAAHCPVPALITDNPYLAYARASHLFDPQPAPNGQRHPSALVADSATIGRNVTLGANVVIDADVVLGDNVVIGAGSVVGQGSVLGADTRLNANVTLYHGVVVGARCCLHSGVVVGADGFGFAPAPPGWQKIAQLGGVVIGDDVEIGANTTIDRGALDDTEIGNGVILDNQIQIAHNVKIGDYTAIAGCTGIAGSTVIGKHCTIAGDVGIAGHLDICDHVHLTMRSDITRSISQRGSYSSGTAMSPTKEWRKNAARFRQLDALAKTVKKLEKTLVTQTLAPPE